MKRLYITLFIFLFLCHNFFAQEGLNLNGYFQPDHRVKLDDGAWLWNENRLSLKMEKDFEEKAKFSSDIWFRTIGFENGMLKVPEIKEAKVEVYDFLTKKLDLSIGRQRIKWGSADKINPTDNINPIDMEDIWDFGKHLPSDAIILKYYPNETFRIEAVYIPLYTQPMLPIGDFSRLLFPEFSFPDSFPVIQKPGAFPLPLPKKVAVLVDTILTYNTLPKTNIQEYSSFGFRMSKNILGWDISCSYSYGYDNFPLPYCASVSIDSLNIPKSRNYISINTELIYPRINRIGFDFAGNFFGAGLWGEACYFIPEYSYYLRTEMPDINKYVKQKMNLFFDPGIINPLIPDSLVLDKNKPWIKYVLGTDYTFKNGMYLNFQYAHGFVHERGEKELNDYFIVRLEKKFFNEKLKISPISGGCMIGDFSDYKNQYAIFYLPEIVYYPNDNTELTLGLKLLDGKGTDVFSSIKNYDELFLRLKYSF